VPLRLEKELKIKTKILHKGIHTQVNWNPITLNIVFSFLRDNLFMIYFKSIFQRVTFKYSGVSYI